MTGNDADWHDDTCRCSSSSSSDRHLSSDVHGGRCMVMTHWLTGEVHYRCEYWLLPVTYTLLSFTNDNVVTEHWFHRPVTRPCNSSYYRLTNWQQTKRRAIARWLAELRSRGQVPASARPASVVQCRRAELYRVMWQPSNEWNNEDENNAVVTSCMTSSLSSSSWWLCRLQWTRSVSLQSTGTIATQCKSTLFYVV